MVLSLGHIICSLVKYMYSRQVYSILAICTAMLLPGFHRIQYRIAQYKYTKLLPEHHSEVSYRIVQYSMLYYGIVQFKFGSVVMEHIVGFGTLWNGPVGAGQCVVVPYGATQMYSRVHYGIVQLVVLAGIPLPSTLPATNLLPLIVQWAAKQTKKLHKRRPK